MEMSWYHDIFGIVSVDADGTVNLELVARRWLTKREAQSLQRQDPRLVVMVPKSYEPMVYH
jgi:hypothetical protein